MELSDLYASCLSDPKLKEQYDELKQQHAEVTNKLEKDYKMAMVSLAVTKNNQKRSIDSDFATKIDTLMQKHHNTNGLKGFLSCNASSNSLLNGSVNSDDNSNINGLNTGVISIDEEGSIVKSEASSNENESMSMDNNNINNNNVSNVNDAENNGGDEINQSIANSNSNSNPNDNDDNSDNEGDADNINSEDENNDNNNDQNNNDNNSSNNNSNNSPDDNNDNDNDNDNDGAENKQQHSRDTQEKCKFCYCMFLDQKSLKKHEKSKHSGAKPYLCVRCKKRFNSRQKLSSHIRFSKTSGKCAFGPPKFLHCDQCDKKFKQQVYLNNHKKKHHK